MLKNSVNTEQKALFKPVGYVQPELNTAFRSQKARKDMHAGRTQDIPTVLSGLRLGGLLKITSSVGVEDTATTSAAQRGLKTTLFRKGRAFKSAV